MMVILDLKTKIGTNSYEFLLRRFEIEDIQVKRAAF